MGHGEGHIVWLSNVAVLKTDCCSSAAESCLTLCDLIPGSPVEALLSFSRSLLELMSIMSMMPSNHLILCLPLLLLPSTFPSIRVFSNELALHTW